MTLDEIFSEISAHMVKGLMIHAQLADYYDFIGLCGYKKCHEYHYYTESIAFRDINSYFMSHHNRLIPYKPVENPNVIPKNWYSHERWDVDLNTRRNAVRDGVYKWVEWERETKKLYERMYKELLDINEIASAIKIQELISDVDYELVEAEKHYIEKEASGYDAVSIVEEQELFSKTYSKKIKNVF